MAIKYNSETGYSTINDLSLCWDFAQHLPKGCGQESTTYSPLLRCLCLERILQCDIRAKYGYIIRKVDYE